MACLVYATIHFLYSVPYCFNNICALVFTQFWITRPSVVFHWHLEACLTGRVQCCHPWVECAGLRLVGSTVSAVLFYCIIVCALCVRFLFIYFWVWQVGGEWTVAYSPMKNVVRMASAEIGWQPQVMDAIVFTGIAPYQVRTTLSQIIKHDEYLHSLLNSFQPEGEQIHRTCGKIPISQWRQNKWALDILSEIKFQPILFVDSSEIRRWNSPERCEINLSYSPVIFTKSSKMMFLCR